MLNAIWLLSTRWLNNEDIHYERIKNTINGSETVAIGFTKNTEITKE